MPPQPIHTAATATTTPLAQKLRKLASGVHAELDKRDWYYSDNSNPARYAFFAFMGLAIIVAIIMICMVNVRRMRAGRAPVISSYLAPPNYHQSQVQYEGQTTTNLPTYTPAPNPNQDVGYYDKNGNFIPSTTIVVDPSQSTSTADVEMSNNPFSSATPDQSQTPYTSQQPYQSSNMPSAYTQSPAINEPQSVGDMSYRRPTGPPPNRTYTHSVTGAGAGAGASGSTSNAVGSTSAEAGAVDELPPYVEPETPQMGHYKN